MSNPPNSTNTLQRTINVAQNFVRNAPLTFSGTNDPALTIADWVRQFILGPPFAWRWNRQTATFTTTAPTTNSTTGAVTVYQDYEESIEQFGWLEKATVTDNTTVSAPVVHELEVVLNLGEETLQNLPTRIAARLDDGNGNITFRLMPPPDKVYTVTLTYQAAAPLFQNLSDTWAPIPDYFSNLYNTGFMAKAYEYLNDGRFAPMLTTFLRQVIAANGGLTDTQANFFLFDQTNIANTQQSMLQGAQMGRQGRGLA
jgi:hypothetical protein